MYARSVASSQGWQWVVNGFGLFRKSPFMWIAFTLVLALIWMLSFAIQIIGPLVFNLLSPVFFAGLMLGCRTVEQGEDLELAHLFSGFRTRAPALVTLGGVHLVGSIVIVGLFYSIAGGSSLNAVLAARQVPREAAVNISLALLTALALYTPLLMVVWFAPLLVVFEELAPLAAMRSSFIACCKNIMPFLLYGVVLFVLFLLAIPLLIGLLVLMPIVFCSIYASYRDIFVSEQRAVPGPAVG